MRQMVKKSRSLVFVQVELCILKVWLSDFVNQSSILYWLVLGVVSTFYEYIDILDIIRTVNARTFQRETNEPTLNGHKVSSYLIREPTSA